MRKPVVTVERTHASQKRKNARILCTPDVKQPGTSVDVQLTNVPATMRVFRHCLLATAALRPFHGTLIRLLWALT
jgi:hypothetical protein